MTKNIGKSIRTRLLNLAKEEKQEYMKVLVRPLHERLLLSYLRKSLQMPFSAEGQFAVVCIGWIQGSSHY